MVASYVLLVCVANVSHVASRVGLKLKAPITFASRFSEGSEMCASTDSHRAILITGLTWSLNSMAPKRENPSNLAPFSALRLQQGKGMKGTGRESHFERRPFRHRQTPYRQVIRVSA